MIAQQINLYQDSLKQKPLSIGFYLGIASCVAVFIGFGIMNTYLVDQLHNQRRQLEQTHNKLAAEQARVKLFESQIAKQETDSGLIAELELWQKKVEDLQQTLAILNNNKTAQAQGFSIYFQALANQSISDAWLTLIHFDAEQQLINFEGSTYKADKIPYFLQQLQNEPAFHGRTFAQLQIQKSDKEPNLINFKLSTHLDPVKKDHVE